MIGAGAGLSASAGLTHEGERFQRYFGDFAKKYGIRDIYSGGFYPFPTLEEYWAWWSRHIMVNRYEDAPKPVYQDLLALVEGREYFVLTTNVDHCFQKAGLDKKRLFYTQGDYGLFQCSQPCHQATYDNEETVRRMVAEQKDMKVPTGLIPRCPKCGRPMSPFEKASAFVPETPRTAGQCGCLGAEKRRGFLLLFVVTSSVSLAPPRAAGLAHCAVPPLPTGPASLGSGGGPLRPSQGQVGGYFSV